MSDIAPMDRWIGQRLKALRQHLGVKPVHLASALEVESEALRHYESGRRRIRVDQLPAIARRFGLRVFTVTAWLFSDAQFSELAHIEKFAARLSESPAANVAEHGRTRADADLGRDRRPDDDGGQSRFNAKSRDRSAASEAA